MFVQLAAATKKRDHLCSSFGCYTLSYNICKTPHLHTEHLISRVKLTDGVLVLAAGCSEDYSYSFTDYF